MTAFLIFFVWLYIFISIIFSISSCWAPSSYCKLCKL